MASGNFVTREEVFNPFVGFAANIDEKIRVLYINNIGRGGVEIMHFGARLKEHSDIVTAAGNCAGKIIANEIGSDDSSRSRLLGEAMRNKNANQCDNYDD